MNIEWAEPPPQTRGRNGLYKDFAIELRQHPMRWAKYPREFATRDIASQASSNQKRGRMVSLPMGEFETAARGIFLFVRYVGE